ncbi:MAG: DUF4115 domain-containing protein [Alphaproteobacteria bacterium]|nr:DUF4115 domain-containing protein [Alphaproteobacteria bacterium]
MLRPDGSDTPPPEGQSAAAPARASARVVTVDPGLRAGEKLEAARTQLGLSLEELSERLRIRADFLEALEAMNAKLLPGKAYTLAYLRSYARELGLDAPRIVTQFQEECALSREDDRPQVRSPRSRPRTERPWLAFLAVGAIAAGFVAWQALRPPPAEEVAAAVPPPVVSGPAPSLADAPPAYAPRSYVIKAVAQARLEVRGADGTTQLYREMQPGDSYTPDPSPGWTLHTSDGGAFEVYVDGTFAGLLGDEGKPVIGRRLDSIQPPVQAGATQASQRPAG